MGCKRKIIGFLREPVHPSGHEIDKMLVREALLFQQWLEEAKQYLELLKEGTPRE